MTKTAHLKLKPKTLYVRGKYSWQRKATKVGEILIDVTVNAETVDAEGDIVINLSAHRHGTLTFEGEGILTKSELEILVRKLQAALAEA
jgi:hypothetical protein